MHDFELQSACESEEKVYQDFLAWFNEEYDFSKVLGDALDEFLDDYIDGGIEKG